MLVERKIITPDSLPFTLISLARYLELNAAKNHNYVIYITLDANTKLFSDTSRGNS